jgi:hypothetical protein
VGQGVHGRERTRQPGCAPGQSAQRHGRVVAGDQQQAEPERLDGVVAAGHEAHRRAAPLDVEVGGGHLDHLGRVQLRQRRGGQQQFQHARRGQPLVRAAGADHRPGVEVGHQP